MDINTFDDAYRILCEKEKIEHALKFLEGAVKHATEGFTFEETLKVDKEIYFAGELKDFINELNYKLLLDFVKQFCPNIIDYYKNELEILKMEFERL